MFVGGVTPPAGTINLTLQAVSTGVGSNPEVGTVITWTNPPPGAQPTATVAVTDFTGGINAESDPEFAARLKARVRHKPAAGNWSHFRSWARESTVAVDDAWVYPCALHAGSVLVAVAQKRGTALGPLARVPSIGTLALVTGYLVPPASPVVPARAFVLVTGVTASPCDIVVQLAQRKGSAAGWADRSPWPSYTPAYPTGVEITAINVGGNPLVFDVDTDVASPVAVPSIMVWDDTDSILEALVVASVANPGGDTRRITLSSAPATTLALGLKVSPDMARRDVLAAAVVAYFDELGPGEVIDLATDARAARAFRNPEPTEERPSRAGIAVISRSHCST